LSVVSWHLHFTR